MIISTHRQTNDDLQVNKHECKEDGLCTFGLRVRP
jgi:hypothetical protein